MKKVLIGVLALIMVLGIVGCSSTPATEETSTTKPTETTPIETESQTPEPTPGPTSTEAPSSWEIAHYVDDFGDETDEVYLQGVFSGEFSNTATANSELTVAVFYDYDIIGGNVIEGKTYYTSGDYSMSFRLLEYNDHKVVFNNSDEMTLKVKKNEEIYEYSLGGMAPNGDLFITTKFDESGNYPPAMSLATILRGNEDIPCIIEIGSSKYSFTMTGIGFGELDKQLSDIKYQAITK